MKGQLNNYRYDLILEMIPEERLCLIALIRGSVPYADEETRRVARDFLRILGVNP